MLTVLERGIFSSRGMAAGLFIRMRVSMASVWESIWSMNLLLYLWMNSRRFP